MFRDNEVFWGTFFTAIFFALVVSWFDIDTAPITHMLGQLWDWAHDPTPLIDGFREWLMWALGAGGMVLGGHGIRVRVAYALAWLWSVAGYNLRIAHTMPERWAVRLDILSSKAQGDYHAWHAANTPDFD